LAEKKTFVELGIPTCQFFPVDCVNDLYHAAESLAFPFVLKTRRLGYDGKGQIILREFFELESAWEKLNWQPCIAENWIDFEFEVSQIAARDHQGNIVYYPLVYNIHHEGILRESHAPYNNLALMQAARDYIKILMEKFNYIGVLTVEFFVKNGKLIANEMAPRVHNSGHWTIEGAVISQFENHMRAVAGLPLGDTQASSNSVMINLIGHHPDLNELIKLPNVHCHLYGKSPAKGRKLGHLTVVNADLEALNKTVKKLRQLIGSPVLFEPNF
jgi:5-(carboxyamino)imidazole ribonucleotide synthase